MARRDGREQTDVFLDVPELKVDEITLKVEGLRAKVSLQAEVLQLLKLNVGVDACLDCVDLTIRGVKAQAQLQVRLDNVVRAIERVLETIDNNPEILTNLTSGAGQAVADVGGGAKETVGEVGKGAGEATKEVGGEAGEAAKDTSGKAGEATKGIGSIPTQAARHVAHEAGDTARDLGSKAGKKAKDLATRELISVLGNRGADAAEKVIKRFTTKED